MFSATALAATKQNDDAKILDRLERANSDPGRRILIKGGTVVSMDARIGNLAQGDVLIEGSKIKEVATDLSPAARDGKAITLEAKNTIVLHGFVDPHIHAWEGQIAGIIPKTVSRTTPTITASPLSIRL